MDLSPFDNKIYMQVVMGQREEIGLERSNMVKITDGKFWAGAELILQGHK